MRSVRALTLVISFVCIGFGGMAAQAPAPTPSEDYYLSECFETGHEIGICRCIAAAMAPMKDAKADLVAALMKEYILKEGDRAIELDPARVKQDLPRLNVTGTDAEIARAVQVIAIGAKCQE